MVVAWGSIQLELELELIQTQMAQKPMLRAEVYAHAMRASQTRKKEVKSSFVLTSESGGRGSIQAPSSSDRGV